MGSEDSMPKKQACQHNQIKYKLKILLVIILSNLLTIYITTSPHSNFDHPLSKISPLPFWDTTPLLLTLNSTQEQLLRSHSEIADLRSQLKSSHELLGTLLDQISHLSEAIGQTSTQGSPGYDELLEELYDEAKQAIGAHKLPLGDTPRIGSEIYASIGAGCLKHKQDLEKYMSYQIGGECPTDDIFAQTLMLKGCEPLPRRRCHPKSPPDYDEPAPLPESLWATPRDSSIIWEPYTCKNYTCLIERKKFPGSYDCKDCFDLEGREKTRWLSDRGLDYGIDEVLATKRPGTVRIGLDVGGGSGTFAARMRERNVTIITTSMNFDGPFNSFIASRGLVPMHVSISQRFPFFENTLDIVHSMHVLSNWIPDVMLEFALYDIYRVLRPGGLFWLDRFFCFGSQLNATYVPLFERVGFKRLRWNTGMKLDRGIQKNEWYFSALLEKPMT